MAYQDIFKSVNKTAAAMLTPQAKQAAMQPPPQDPAAMGGMTPGAPPMDPSMMGAPAGAPPMDPAAMGGMPPQGAPMDPSMMGGAPMGQPGAWMQDQMFLQFLQSMGVQVQPDGSAIDPNGQPVPPEMMDQIYAQFQQQMAAQQGGMPPEGMPPEGALGEMPPEGAPEEASAGMPPEEMLNQMAGMVQDIIDSTMEEKMAAIDKKLSANTDKLDTIKLLLDDIIKDSAASEKAETAEDAKIDDEIANDLASAQEGAPVELAPTEQMLAPTAAPGGNMLDIMKGNA